MNSSDKVITLSLKPEENNILLTISHSGKGLKEEHLINLFRQGCSLPDDEINIDFHFIANSLSEIGAGIKAENLPHGFSLVINFPLIVY